MIGDPGAFGSVVPGVVYGGSNSCPSVCLPLPRQKFVQAGDGKIGDGGGHIGEPHLWVDAVETAGRNDGEHDGGSIGPRWEPAKVQFSPLECNSSQRALGRLVLEANPAIFEETGKTIPTFQHVIDRLAHLGLFAERDALPF